MNINQLNAKLNKKLNQLNKDINAFFNFISFRLKNYPKLTMGEQISYPAIGLGLILILASVVLFII